MSTFTNMMAIRSNITMAVQKDYNVNHIITFFSDTEDQFIIDIFTDGLVPQFDPKSKQLVSYPRLVSTVRTEVKYKDIIRFMRVIEKMIKHYEKKLAH